ncbi:MAG: Zc3h12a-like Ribonuclease domain, partial [Acidimicrobiales bacterium]|nr:Zc3h12a-like Ribonuclease domain [Acidimicrobiales bacterium]
MPQRKVIVDGSNLATEGRTLPSLAQLDEAVRAFRSEHPDDEIIVVVDASFEYRVDAAERRAYEEAELAGEIVSPPAGAIGRGDGFLLQIADRTGAVVLSNDSFQEFHGEYEWLFSKGRLIGGKPVPGIGWFFTPRTPVRGPKSREAVKEAKRQQARIGSPESSKPMPVPKAPPPKAKAAKAAKAARSSKKMNDAIAEATAEAIAPGVGKKRRSRRRGGGGGGGGGGAGGAAS